MTTDIRPAPPVSPIVGLLAGLLNAQIVRFGLVSVVATVVDFAFLLATARLTPDTPLWNGVAIAAGYAAGTVAHFYLSRRLVFKPSVFHIGVEFLLVCVVAAIAFGLTELLVLWLHRNIGLSLGVAKFITLFPVFAWNYIGRRYFIYHRTNDEG